MDWTLTTAHSCVPLTDKISPPIGVVSTSARAGGTEPFGSATAFNIDAPAQAGGPVLE
jgi:hypothetical protein